jgi:signal peptidase I
MLDLTGPVRYILWGLAAAVLVFFFYRDKLAKEWTHFRTDTKGWLYAKWKDWGEPLLVALVLAVAIRIFIFAPFKIPSGSMIPTLLVGDRIFVEKITYRFSKPERGDIIVFKFPLDQKKNFKVTIGGKRVGFKWDSRRDFVKRLVGLPGDKIEIKDGKLVVNGEALEEPPFSDHYYYNKEDWEYAKLNQVIEVPAGHYFALDDNSAQSSDSRDWGFVPENNMVGKAFFIWWPPKRVKFVN